MELIVPCTRGAPAFQISIPLSTHDQHDHDHSRPLAPIDERSPKSYAEDVVPAARFTPSQHYLPATVLAFAAALFSTWWGTHWTPAYIPAGLLFLIAGLLLYAVLRPAIEVYDVHLAIGTETIAWNQIRRIDRTGWVSPLVLYLTLLNERRIQIVYPGDADSGQALLRYLRRNSREALIDGVPYRQFWGEILPAPPVNPPTAERKPVLTSPKYRMLRTEDEEEVERLFQRLKAVGHLDPKNQSDTK